MISQSLTPSKEGVQSGCNLHPRRVTPPLEGQGEVIKLGYYSPSQNGMVIDPRGIAHCLCGGGRGHDVDKPKILIVYE